jgi:hypothetical protein
VTSAAIPIRRTAMIHDPEPASTPAPQTCPVCQQPLRYFPLAASALLDWVEVLDEDLATLRDHFHDLKAAVASSVLP